MSSLEEREENNLKIDFLIKEASGIDQAASEYLYAIAMAARITDDIKDELTSINIEDSMCLIELLFVKIPGNVFYRKHQDMLFAQHLVLWNAWEASNILEKGDDTDKIYAHVLRDYINELLPLVAYLTQGCIKMKEVNALIRHLFKKQLGE